MKRIYFFVLMGLMSLIGLLGCKSIEYVPVEVVKTETVHQTDTVEKAVENINDRETIIREARPEDSLLLARLGIKLQDNERMLILLRRELSETKNELKERHGNDSVRVEYKDKPFPVEKQLSRWQQFCCDYGKVMFGVSVFGVLLFILLIVARIKGWKWPL